MRGLARQRPSGAVSAARKRITERVAEAPTAIATTIRTSMRSRLAATSPAPPLGAAARAAVAGSRQVGCELHSDKHA